MGISDWISYGEATNRGDRRFPHLPCNFYPDYKKGQWRGVCIFPMDNSEPVGTPFQLDRGKQIYNLGADDPPHVVNNVFKKKAKKST